MFPSIGSEGKTGLITADKMESSDIGVIVEAPKGGGDCGGSCSWDWEDFSRPEVLARLGGGGLSTGHV